MKINRRSWHYALFCVSMGVPLLRSEIPGGEPSVWGYWFGVFISPFMFLMNQLPIILFTWFIAAVALTAGYSCFGVSCFFWFMLGKRPTHGFTPSELLEFDGALKRANASFEAYPPFRIRRVRFYPWHLVALSALAACLLGGVGTAEAAVAFVALVTASAAGIRAFKRLDRAWARTARAWLLAKGQRIFPRVEFEGNDPFEESRTEERKFFS